MLTNETINELIEKAIYGQSFSYSPYSSFRVGAALLSKDGRIYTGCNIENAAYSPTNCAERTAFFKAISEGVRDFEAIAIIGNKKGEKREKGDYCAPCGVCRQVMAEFCNPEEFKIILTNGVDDYKIYSLAEVLPLTFTPKELN